MSPITLTGFAGAILAEHPRQLPEAIGVDCKDAEPGRHELRPLHQRLTVASVQGGMQTIYRLGRDTPSDTNYWFAWGAIVNAIRGFDGSDTTERTYFTGSGTPKWTNNVIGLAGGPPYPQGTRELAVPAPIIAPTTVLTTDGSGDAGDRFYCYTFVNDLGWESAPSPLSSAITVKPGAIVAISNLDTAPPGNYGITRKRIYRTQPGSTAAADFFFLRELSVGTTSTTDDARSLGEVIPSVGWLPPAADAHGLIALWNGMAALLTGKTISFCEPEKFYAWPVAYDIESFDTPIATASWEQNLLVLTTARPLLVQGQDPAGMSATPLPLSQPCASARSVVAFGHGVVWASNEGLVYAGSLGQRMLTEGEEGGQAAILTPRQWKALVPSSIIAGRYGRLYVASYNDGSGRKGFLIDPLRPTEGITFLTSGFDACFYDDLADKLYVLEGTAVRVFDGHATLTETATFRSKVFRQTFPRAFGWCKVVATSYPVQVKVWADGVLKLDRAVANERAFALPSGFVAEDWQIEVSATDSVQSVRLAAKPADLIGV